MIAVRLALVAFSAVLLAGGARAQTPNGCATSTVTTGGTAVTAIIGNANGYTVANPFTATDEGLGATEPLYVNIVTIAGTVGNDTTFSLQPGQSFGGPVNVAGGMTVRVSVNAASSGHKFSCTRW